MTDSDTAPLNFIQQIVKTDVAGNLHGDSVITRFPPEPNGYLHIGHAKSICLNFGIARDFSGHCYLRFDDTNPDRESTEYVESIKADVQWLGFDFRGHLTHASDYFKQLYIWAIELIENGKAYVCSLTAEEIRAARGTLTTPGIPSPYRNRGVAENLDLFKRMRAGEFPDGTHVLRARIDMTAPNMNLRDPTLYRIRHQPHQNSGSEWCIYPMYDFTHPLSDAVEGVTHSLCTLEFEDHRPLYDWVLDNVTAPCRPRQIEFSRLALDYTVMSKRLLTSLVAEQHVDGWDDPRMPTLSGLRRRGYTSGSIRTFCHRIGITKKEQQIELAALENCVREDLESHVPRRLGVQRPLKIVIENYPDDQSEEFPAPNHPADSEMGMRTVPFCREILIEQSDFMENPPAKFFRLAPGREVRLRYAYYVTCTDVIKDATGQVTELRCRYDPDSRGGGTADGRKVKGTLHWVSARHSLAAEIRLYNPLFTVANPLADPEVDLRNLINKDSLVRLDAAQLEPSVAQFSVGSRFQLERLGYFCIDPDSKSERPVLNRIVTLRDSRPKSNTR